MTHATIPESSKSVKSAASKWGGLIQEPLIRRAIVLGIAAILIWRGIWLLTDLFLVPSNLPLSGALSIIIGLVIFMIYGEVRL